AALALAAIPVVCLVIAFLHLRHVGLALAAAFAPLPGLIAAASLVHGATVEPLSLAYLTGLTVALFLADDIALRVIEGAGGPDAMATTLKENWLACCAAILAASAFTALLLFAGHHARTPFIATCAELAAGFGALIVLPLIASLLPFGEDFVARANRLRELRERLLEKIAAVTEPHWGWSLTGIGVVFLALAFFGSRSLHATPGIAHSAPVIWLVAMVVTIGASLAATRDWRRSLAVLIALGLAALTGCWGFARAGVPLNVNSWLALMQVLGIGAVLVLLVAAAARPDADEDATAASVRSLLGKTSAAVASSLCALTVLLALSLSLGGEALALAVVIVFAGVGAVLLQPALTIAIETLAPRRSTIEARYRVN
ncbi:MAG: hypothetical protein ABSC92_15575, partial [Rhizomicrobium sp.]